MINDIKDWHSCTIEYEKLLSFTWWKVAGIAQQVSIESFVLQKSVKAKILTRSPSILNFSFYQAF